MSVDENPIKYIPFLDTHCTNKLKRIIRGNTFIVDWDIMRVNGYVDRRGSGS